MQTYVVTQRITALINRYVVHTEAGAPVAFVEQKRFSFREEVTFFRDESRREPLLRFKARSVIDLGATYDVTAADGTALGTFRKDFARSLLRSTWHLEPAGGPRLSGQERSAGVAVARRVWELIPYVDVLPFAVPYHFDFSADGAVLLSVDKKLALRDRYLVRVDEERLDPRLAVAMAVALDALQSR